MAEAQTTSYPKALVPPHECCHPQGLKDYGVDIGLPRSHLQDEWSSFSAAQWLLKFSGRSGDRVRRDYPIIDEIRDSGCHWACRYPINKRPRRVRNGAVIVVGRLVGEPNDILIYGRAIGTKYAQGRDDATPADIQRRGLESPLALL